MQMTDDWRYTDERLAIRGEALSILLKCYGCDLNSSRLSKYKSQAIYECAHDWVSQGNNDCDGILDYFKNNYYAEQ